MNIVIAGGTGFIGHFLTKRFLSEGHHVTLIGRSRGKIEHTFGKQVTILDWNTLRQLGAGTIANNDLIINLCGANIADKRWSNARKHELINSRTKPTKTLSQLCVTLGKDAPALFNASAVGIYGIENSDTPKDEASHLPRHAKDFAQEIVLRWEAALKPAVDAGVRVVKMRFGVVFGKNGGALKKLLPIFKLGMGGKIGSGQQPFPWISMIDLFRAIEFCYQHKDIHGPVNFVSPEMTTQAQLAKTIGKLVNRPTFISTPAFVMNALYGEMAKTLLLNGQYVIPKILTTHKFEFQHASLESALEYAFLSRKD